MLSLDEIHAKVRSLNRIATSVPEPARTDYRKLALNWRLIELEAAFMDAMQSSLDEHQGRLLSALPSARLRPDALARVLKRIDDES